MLTKTRTTTELAGTDAARAKKGPSPKAGEVGAGEEIRAGGWQSIGALAASVMDKLRLPADRTAAGAGCETETPARGVGLPAAIWNGGFGHA